MSKTKEKLEESKFFLEQLERNYEKNSEVRYYLSAYISAAGSVTWIMRSEYQNVPGWEEWYASQTPDTEKMQFLKNMNDLRVKTVKQEPIQIHYMVEFQIPTENVTKEVEEYFQTSQGRKLSGELRIADNTNDRKEIIVSGNMIEGQFIFQRAYITIEGFPDEDILDVCKEYYSMIEQLVITCEKLFAANNT
jgi:hypothetical protein